MIADLHIHYPMHIVPRLPIGANAYELKDLTRDRDRALAVEQFNRRSNYRDARSGPRVTVPRMQSGGVGVAFSVIYSMFDELEPGEWSLGAPRPEYVENLSRMIDAVDAEVLRADTPDAVVVRSLAQLDAARSAGQIAIVHCVEGGFSLGATESAVRASVAALAKRGVAYITLAHLFFRGVAGNAPALPLLGEDCVFNTLFSNPDVGLTHLGIAAVEAMREHRVLIDVTHMNQRALDDTFALLDALDRNAPGPPTPVIASHSACRLRDLEYNLSDDSLKKIHARGGVVGLLNCPHFLNDKTWNRVTEFTRRQLRAFGLRDLALDRQRSLDLLCRHVDHAMKTTGTHEGIALGSDLDGYVKPTLPGIETADDLCHVESALRIRFGQDLADSICHGNVLRLLRRIW